MRAQANRRHLSHLNNKKQKKKTPKKKKNPGEKKKKKKKKGVRKRERCFDLLGALIRPYLTLGSRLWRTLKVTKRFPISSTDEEIRLRLAQTTEPSAI